MSTALNPEQRAAVERAGQDVCVVAGPGTGKTTVLIERFKWLVVVRGVDPARILAITFTEKAAAEIKQRLVAAFESHPIYRGRIERAWVSTIHGFCARLLREHSVAAGLAPDFAVLDEAWSESLLRQSAVEMLEALYRERPDDVRALLESLDLAAGHGRQADLAGSLMAAYQAMRESGGSEPAGRAPIDDVEPALRQALAGIAAEPAQRSEEVDLQQWCREFLAAPADSPRMAAASSFSVNLGRLGRGSAIRAYAKEIKEHLLPRYEGQLLGEFFRPRRELLELCLARLDLVYRARKRDLSQVDFADLEERVVELLKSDEALRADIRASFDEILMDELQDTNRLQWRLLDLLRRPGRFFAVGDINQSIYGFRNAEPRVFDSYRAATAAQGGRIDQLRDNHRSRPEILAAVARVLNGRTGIEPHPLMAKRQYPPKPGPAIEWMVGMGDEASRVEAEWIGARVRELRGTLPLGAPGEQRPAEFRDIAILVRALGSLEPIERALEALGIPYLVIGGRTFFETREVRDLRNMLSVLANALDQIALAGVLRSPLVGVSDETILRWSGTRFGELPGDLPSEERERLDGFAKLVERLRAVSDALPPDRLLAEAIDWSDYAAGISGRARANIEKFLTLARDRQRSRPQSLARLLADLDTLRDAQAEPEAPPPDAANVVRVMTIHAAKGLEFPIVFVPALQRAPDTRCPALLFSAERGFGAKWRHPLSGRGQSDAVHRHLQEELGDKEEAEENRLLYVAMTRAKEHLVLSAADSKRMGNWAKFAAEALEDPAGFGVRVVRTDTAPASIAAGEEEGSGEEDTLLVRPAAPGQYDSAAAVTSIAVFYACPRKYYLGRYLNLSPGTAAPWREGLEQSSETAFETTDGADAAAIGLETHAILAGTPPLNPDPEAVRLARRFLESGLGQRVKRAGRVEREFDFMFCLHDVVLSGKIDLWFEEGGELVLVDYKTDRDLEGLASYALQLRLYALALERFRRMPDRAILHFLRLDRAIPVSLSKADLAEVAGTARAFRDAQARVRFPLKINHQCLRCSFYRTVCPADRATATT